MTSVRKKKSFVPKKSFAEYISKKKRSFAYKKGPHRECVVARAPPILFVDVPASFCREALLPPCDYHSGPPLPAPRDPQRSAVASEVSSPSSKSKGCRHRCRFLSRAE
ncbi:hypothetical protein TNCV_635841 [Trichonephila clavipes]|nr:hypothetical protein TNCV_635841 [Trichonephila clavipes]